MSVTLRTIAKSLLGCALVLAPLAVAPRASVAFAQSSTNGAIGGTVTDASGALLPGTVITIKSLDTGVVRTSKTNSSGEYRVSELPPGNYSITFTSDGFQTAIEKSVVVTVGGTANVTPKLLAGSVSDKVEVSAELPPIKTAGADISTTIDQNAIENLPINGRRWSDFALLTPGVVSNSDGFGLLSFRGISYLLNNNTVDGADDNQAYFSEARGRTRSAYTVTQGAVQEFQVNTSNYSAEYGRAAGGVINTVTKSGGNQLHGSTYFYDRDNGLAGASNPYTQLYNFDSNTGIHPQNIKPKDWRKQYGFGVGGPIWKDRIFWFYAFDQQKRNFPGVARTTDPYDMFALAAPTLGSSETCTRGFSVYNGTNEPWSYGAPLASYTNGTAYSSGAFSVTANLSNPTTTGGAQYPVGATYQGNFGACALAAAIAPATAAGAALPYQQAAAYYNQGLQVLSSFFGMVQRFGNQTINFPKLDWQINDRNRMTIQYNRVRWDSPNGVQTQTSNFYGRGSYGDDFMKADVGIFRFTTVLTNSLVNNFLAQYGRDMETEFSGNRPIQNELGLQNALPTGECSAPHGGPCPMAAPDISVGYGYDAQGFDAGTSALFNRYALPDERRLQLKDDMTFSHGKHILKWGLDYNKVGDYINNLYNGYGTYSYDWAYGFIGDYLHKTASLGGATYAGDGTAHTYTSACTTGSTCQKNVGLYSSFSQGFTVPDANGNVNAVGAGELLTTREYAGYITDDWRITPKLTLTLGVRYEYQYVPTNPTPNPDLNGQNQTFLTYGVKPNTSNRPDDRNNVAPRLGFAYNVFGDGKTVIRGGFGIYYGRIVNANIVQSFQNSGGPNSQVNISGIYPDYAVANESVCRTTFPNIQTYANAKACAAATTTASSHPSVSYLDSKLENPQVYETDLDLTQDFGHGWVGTVTYMGSYGRKLDSANDVNLSLSTFYDKTYVVNNTPLFPATRALALPHGGLSAPLPSGTVPVRVYTGSRRNANYYRVLDIQSNVNTNYNAIAFQLNKRYRNGFSFLSNYTWAHSLDANPYIGTGIPSFNILDPNDLSKEYGNSSLDVRQRFVTAFSYQPVTHFHGWKDYAMGGWRLAPVVQAQTGLPYTPYISGYPGESASGVRSANGAGGTSGRIDAIHRNQYHRPNTYKADVRLSKNFYLNNINHLGLDRARFEVFAELFNIFNHQNITGVQNTAYYLNAAADSTQVGGYLDTLTLQPNFGTYTNSNSNYTYTPRQLQLAVRLHF
ncbi:carboxypeptidase regulatory-like domain-containing protein [Granulicella cerasi]|uniref:Carboxypeptidase regulatory-like domain-containing protein n=1 Tax=Granulicella cerasi TaxID=741063 RepID=A0ABW1ZD60_9BACT|nr:TonB-dependent receptor [Granulicella cerasi]